MLPAPMDLEGAAQMVEAWLRGIERDDYGPEPDTDGSTSRGWRVCRTWGAVEVTPHWVEYGK